MTQTHTVRANRTTDHAEIERWIEERQGTPAIIESTWDGNTAVLRVDFGDPSDSLIELSWEEFFRIFDESDQEFMYQTYTSDGRISRVYEFVDRG